MDEDNTTAQPTEQAAVDIDVPASTDVVAEAPVDTDTTEPSEPSTASEEVETPAAPEVDDKLRKFAESQGLELGTPSEIKAASIALKARSEATKQFNQKSELEKTMETVSDEVAEVNAQQTGQDPEVLKRLQRMEVKESVRDFWANNPEARAYETDMIRIVNEKPHLAGDFDALYATAVLQAGKLDAVKSQGKQEALQNLVHTQTAAVPRGNATNPGTTPKSKPFNELSIAEMEAQLGKVRR